MTRRQSLARAGRSGNPAFRGDTESRPPMNQAAREALAEYRAACTQEQGLKVAASSALARKDAAVLALRKAGWSVTQMQEQLELGRATLARMLARAGEAEEVAG